MRLATDSALVAQQSGYPNLKSTNVLIGLTPMVASADAEVLYRGQLSKLFGMAGRQPDGRASPQAGSGSERVFVVWLS